MTVTRALKCKWSAETDHVKKVGQLLSSFPYRGGDFFPGVKKHIMEGFPSTPSSKTLYSIIALGVIFPGSDKLESFYISYLSLSYHFVFQKEIIVLSHISKKTSFPAGFGFYYREV